MAHRFRHVALALTLCALCAGASAKDAGKGQTAMADMEKDTFQTSAGPLEITFVGHGTLMMAFGGKTIHIDPVMREADYTKMPDADLVLITHGHFDHLDPKALAAIRKGNTQIVGPPHVQEKVEDALVMKNGDTRTVDGIQIEAVPAYNIVHKRDNGEPFHPKGWGNGYVVTFGDKRVYIAGDTENVPEMANLKNIDIAFLPMNLPYTMTPEMVAEAARVIRPKVLYPYHYGETDPEKLVALLEDEKDIDVRVRSLE